MSKITFRQTVRQEDLPIVEEILISSGFFYDIEIPVALELVEDRLEHGDLSDYQIIFAEIDSKIVAYACFGLIPGTLGSYDLYWIATHNDLRGKGIGIQLLEEVHRIISILKGRILIAETSSLEKYAPTRHFYLSAGYSQEAKLADFYRVGDDKIFFVKRIS